MRFIGDVHGKFKHYLEVIGDAESSVQCGDMGTGFISIPVIEGDHDFIRGNHDNPFVCHKHKNWIKDGTFRDGIFFLGGAWSIDWEWRQNLERATGRRIWWPTEECSVPRLQRIIDFYGKCKPDIVVSHDCPLVMARVLNSQHSWDKSKTRQALDRMFEIHHPEFWIFGHHHVSTSKLIEGTRFVALDELAHFDI